MIWTNIIQSLSKSGYLASPACSSVHAASRSPVSIRQHTSASVSMHHPRLQQRACRLQVACQHTSAYVSIRQHTSAYITSVAFEERAFHPDTRSAGVVSRAGQDVSRPLHTSAYVSIRQHTSAHVSTRQHTSAHVSIRQYTSVYVSIREHM